ncbi:MAG TPA: ATP-binding protein, partial [Chitinophagaceae bacterium]|nr:ATP-binding protein [Chitinophagaceae bacterium]
MSNSRKIFGLFATGAACILTGGIPSVNAGLVNCIVTALAPNFAADFLSSIDYKKLLIRTESPDKLNHYLDKLIIPTSVKAMQFIKQLYLNKLKKEHQLTWFQKNFKNNPINEAERVLGEMANDWQSWKKDELIDKEMLHKPELLFNEICNYVFNVSSADRTTEEWSKITSFFKEKLPQCFELAFKDAIVDNANEPAFKSYQIEMLRGVQGQNQNIQNSLDIIQQEIKRLQNGGPTNQQLINEIELQNKELEKNLINHFDKWFSELVLKIDAIKDDTGFIREHIEEIVKPLYPRRLTNIPKPMDGVIGRDKDIQALEKLVASAKKPVLIRGIGGIGKTTLAKHFVQSCQADYDHIAWIEVKTEDTGHESDMTTSEAFVYDRVLIKNLRLDLTKESMQEKFGFICNSLSQIGGKNLLIIDNAKEDLDRRDIKDILPDIPFWRIVITSRHSFNGFE